MTPTKDKAVKVASHGASYRVVNDRLEYKPLLAYGKPDPSIDWVIVEESPKDFQKGHVGAIKKLLGNPSEKKVGKIISKVKYY